MKAIKLLATGALLLGAAGMVVPSIAADAKPCDSGTYHTGKDGHHGGKHAGHFGRMERALDLSDAQKETLKSQREANKAARAALHDQLKEARTALNTATEAGANDAELNSLAETLGRLQAQQALAGAKNHQAFLAVLTDEQKQTLAEMKSKRMERKGSRKNDSESKSS